MHLLMSLPVLDDALCLQKKREEAGRYGLMDGLIWMLPYSYSTDTVVPYSITCGIRSEYSYSYSTFIRYHRMYP